MEAFPLPLLMPALALFPVLGCAEETEEPLDLGTPPETLVLPDVSGIDFAAAFKDAIQLTKTVHVGRAWAGQALVLERRDTGCPDLYAGVPVDASIAIDADDDTPGQTWFDACTTPGGVEFSGYSWWNGAVAVSDDGGPESEAVEASREMAGRATVRTSEGLFEFNGEAADALSRTVAADYDRWTWSSSVTGTVTGSEIFAADSLAPGGWRTDLAIYATGGDSVVYEPRGNIFLFDAKLAGRFDSVEIDLAFAGPGAAAPTECAEEPRGWIGLRDENAYWYDVVFQPRYDDDVTGTGTTNEPYGACDGCGAIYIRGVEQVEAIGEICLDFDFVFSESPVTPPVTADYVLPLHSLEDP